MKPKNSYANIPTILVVLGATGDLMAKKIAPALWHLFKKAELPDHFEVVGFSRRELTNDDFLKHVGDVLRNRDDKIPEGDISSFLKFFSYAKGEFENKNSYTELAKIVAKIDKKWGICSNKLFYLAVPPTSYETILKNLKSSGLTLPCSAEEGWTRVIIEKPFGKDFKTARKLDELLSKLFKEIQIYRIDHYLAKEMIQNILVFRFTNNLFEESWGNKLIEKIDIRLLEKIGVESRGAFYDGVGALRDVGQNHLLQMLALITMEYPQKFSADTIRKNRADILQTLKIPDKEEIAKSTFRAQYEGYKSIKGVDSNSKTETYFKIRGFLNHPRWQNVPITMESGKRMGESKKEIVITFAHPAPCLCPKGGEHYKNRLIIHLEPKEGITIQFWSKKPGFKMDIEERTFDFLFRETGHKNQYTEEYEKLLLDCIAGDQTLFVSSEEIKEMWRFTDSISKCWENNCVPLQIYKPDTQEILRASHFIESPPGANTEPILRKEIGIIGLGKMGGNIAKRLMELDWKVAGLNKDSIRTQELEKEGLIGAYSVKELVSKLSKPKIVWVMIPAGASIDEVIWGNAKESGLVNYLSKGDIIIDAGNSFYEDSINRAAKLKKSGINFLDVGVSGGPEGARYGASLMIGGEKEIYEKLEPLFEALALKNGYAYMGKAGAGHFVKMVHNAIEYGMMESLAEGFALMKKSPYKLNLQKVSQVYSKGSVIESRLVGWLLKAFNEFGEDLKEISGVVGATGEAEWTLKTGKKLKVSLPVIEKSLEVRKKSKKNPSYTGKILSALRNQFGGHSVKK